MEHVIDALKRTSWKRRSFNFSYREYTQFFACRRTERGNAPGRQGRRNCAKCTGRKLKDGNVHVSVSQHAPEESMSRIAGNSARRN